MRTGLHPPFQHVVKFLTCCSGIFPYTHSTSPSTGVSPDRALFDVFSFFLTFYFYFLDLVLSFY